MAAEVSLRIATRDDVPMLSRLIADSARALSRGFYTEAETESAIRYVFGVDTELIKDGTYYVAHLDGSLAGCGGWSRRNTLYGGDQRPIGEASFLDPLKEAARIRAFFVAPQAARRGVGRALLHECTKAAAQSGFRSLTLMATLPGVPFYTALGFVAEEDVVDMLPDGTPLRFVRMSRPIGEVTVPGQTPAEAGTS
jgi:GNAT superfamily N-acetyltransferase